MRSLSSGGSDPPQCNYVSEILLSGTPEDRHLGSGRNKVPDGRCEKIRGSDEHHCIALRCNQCDEGTPKLVLEYYGPTYLLCQCSQLYKTVEITQDTIDNHGGHVDTGVWINREREVQFTVVSFQCHYDVDCVFDGNTLTGTVPKPICPTDSPTSSPSTASPSTSSPTNTPSSSPSTSVPTNSPSFSPSSSSTSNPTNSPSSSPTPDKEVGGQEAIKVVTKKHGVLTISTGCDEFRKESERRGLLEEKLAELLIDGLIHLPGVEVIIEDVMCGSTVVEYFVTVPSTSAEDAFLMDSAETNLKAANTNSEVLIQGEPMTFTIVSNEITDVTGGGGEKDISILGHGLGGDIGIIGTLVCLGILCISAIITVLVLRRRSNNQPPNGQVNRDGNRRESIAKGDEEDQTDMKALDEVSKQEIQEEQAFSGRVDAEELV